MTIPGNLSAGIADPYWYEWSIGLLYVVDMLKEDTNIKSVILQESQLQGLDDVVINYNDGRKDCMQIKHTRENNSLTFTDLISKGDKDNSYLSQFARDWKKIKKDEGIHCKVILFTNRKFGKNKYTKVVDKDNKYERPALEDFWPYIRNKINVAKSLKDIAVEETWKIAWNEWINELSVFDSEDEKIEFLRCLDIKANEGDLDVIRKEIINKIRDTFGVGEDIAIRQYQKLCYSLMDWTTTFRTNEEINKEDVYQALSLHSDSFQGIHNLKVPSPFFPSRIQFINDLESKLRNREHPVIFLSGDPGSGKTSIVSYLTNKIDSVISLRFYSYKPITPEDKYLPADKGVSSPRALWGDLLIQLRSRLKGNLSKYRVPVSNELIDSDDTLRKEVLRLAEILANEENRTTVIVIDGIDHAARAESHNTFLETLIPPEGVPDKVCFLIVGQPIHEYPSYPDWLSCKNDKLLRLEIPRLDKLDIIELYEKEITSISKEHNESVIRLIMDISEGNTLPVIYAIYEAKQCKSIEELESRLREKNLSSGLMAYYEYTWKSALGLIPSALFIDYLLAGAIGLINRKLSPELLASIYDDVSIQERVWKSVLRKLYPVLIEEQDGFRILHNDFRIYLEKYLRKSPKEMKEIAYKIADFYTSRSDDFSSKHEIVFRMLKLAEREEKFINVFTAQYVMEAIALSRPIIEIEDQLELTIESLTKASDLRKVNSFSCAISTLYQFKQSMQWLDKDYQGTIKLPSVLQSESKVKSKNLLTKHDLNDVLNEVLWLINENEIPRAKSIMDRWFSKYSPENIFDLLRNNNEIEIKDGKYIFEHSIEPILEKWGVVCQHTGINFRKEKIDDNTPDYYKEARALFYRGWLKEGELFCDEEGLARTLDSLGIHYNKDMENFVLSLIDKNKIEYAKILLDNFYSRNNGSKMFILRCLLWIILSGDSARFNKWIEDINEKEFDYIKDEYFNLTKDSFEGYVIISFILAYLHKDFNYISNKVLHSYREGKISKREKVAIMDLVEVSSYLGDLIRKVKGGLQLNNSEHNEFESIFRVLVNDVNSIGRHEVGGFEIEKLLVRVFMFINNEVSDYFDSALYKVIKEQIVKLDYSKNIDVYWNYLKDKNEIKLLDNLFEHWVGENGEAWKLELSDMYDIGEKFIVLGELVRWSSKIDKVREKLNRKSIGYTGRKEYSLYMPLRWFETLTNYSNNHWEDIGVELLNVSETASKLGDNRASVFVNASIASSAGKTGYGNLWRFATLQEEWDKNWLHTIYDGLISLLEAAEISNDELKNIWRVSAAIFKLSKYSNQYDSSNNIKKVYIHDLRTCILLIGKKFGYKDLDNSLKEIAEEEYFADKGTYDYRLPDRWFENKDKSRKDLLEFNEKVENMPCEEAVMYVIKDYNKQRNKDKMDNNFRWDYISEIVKKYNGKLNIDKHILPLLDILLQRQYKYSWDFDGADRAYEAIFTFLDEKQILKVLSRIVEDYKSEEDNDVRLSSIKGNLEYFSYFYYKNLSEQDIKIGLAEILKTHILWLTGNNVIEYRRSFALNRETNNEPGSWNEFCYNLLDKFLLSKMADSIKQLEKIKDIKQKLEI